jgi:hypothetical protein
VNGREPVLSPGLSQSLYESLSFVLHGVAGSRTPNRSTVWEVDSSFFSLGSTCFSSTPNGPSLASFPLFSCKYYMAQANIWRNCHGCHGCSDHHSHCTLHSGFPPSGTMPMAAAECLHSDRMYSQRQCNLHGPSSSSLVPYEPFL